MEAAEAAASTSAAASTATLSLVDAFTGVAGIVCPCCFYVDSAAKSCISGTPGCWRTEGERMWGGQAGERREEVSAKRPFKQEAGVVGAG